MPLSRLCLLNIKHFCQEESISPSVEHQVLFLILIVNEVWVPRNAKCLGVDLRLPSLISAAAVNNFVKGINIGHVNFIPSCSGVSCTATCFYDP